MSARLPIWSYEANAKGRDFVVGDIHGCFDLLETGLKRIQFDPETDRLFSVGDLVDRGAQSHLALEWLNKPWFMAVRGNHEQMAIDAAEGLFDPKNYAANGGQWFMALEPEEQKRIARAFEVLPFAIEIQTKNGLVGIVHADCPLADWNDLRIALNGHNRHGYENLLMWSRERITSKNEAEVENVSAVIVGHTPVRQCLAFGNVVYLDTGAVFGHKLSLLEIETMTCTEVSVLP